MIFEILLFISLLAGQLGRIQITPAIVIYLHDIVIVLYILVRLPQLWKNRKKIWSFSLVKPLVLLTGVFVISLLANAYRFAASDLLIGVSYLIRYVVYALLYVVIRLDHKPGLFWFRWIFLLGIGYAVLGILQLVVYPDLRNLSYDGWDPHYYRLFSTLFDPNFMGSILLVSFLSGVYFLQKGKQTMWAIAGLATLFAAFLLTYSRSSFVAAIAAFIVYIICTKKWKLLIWLLGFCVVILYIPAIGGESTMLFRKLTAFARVSNWQEGITMFYASPVIGFGFNMVKALSHNAPTLQSGVLARSTSGYDNSVVFILVTTGSIGLAAFVFLWAKMMKLGIGLYQIVKKRTIGIIYLCILIAVFVHGMFLNTLFYPQLMILLWIVSAVAEKEVKE